MLNEALNIQELLIRISGKHPIEETLKLGQDVVIQMIASVVKVETGDNQDGSVNITYVVKPKNIKVIQDKL